MGLTLKEQEYAFWGCLLNYDGEDLVIHLAAAFNEGANVGWFEDPQCRLMWAAADSRWRSGGNAKLTPLDIVAEAQKLSRNPKSEYSGVDIKPDFISKAKQYLYTSGDMASYSKTLREGAMRRSIMSVLRDSAKDFDTADAGQVGSTLVNKVTSILQHGVASKMVPMSSMTDEFMKKFDTAYEEYVIKKNYDYVSGLPLPWRHFSRRIDGLSPGLTLIAARPSVGKSSFALQILEYLAATGQKCVFNCLDMAAQQICQRPASSLSGIPLSKLKRGMPDYHEVRPRLLKAKKTLDAWDATHRLKMMTEPDVDVFVSWCIMRRAQGLLDVVCIDYVQQLQIRGRYNSDNERLTAISAKLKNLAVQYGIPVIALSQLSRGVTRDKDGGEHRAPELSDLRGSGALEQDAYMVIMLHEDAGCANAWISNPPMDLVPSKDDDSGKAVRPIWVSVKKNQNGGLGSFPFIVYQDTFMWYLADGAAEKLPCGAAQNMPKFKRITPDVRKSFLMEYLAQTNHLVPVSSPISESDLVDISEPPPLDAEGNAQDAAQEHAYATPAAPPPSSYVPPPTPPQAPKTTPEAMPPPTPQPLPPPPAPEKPKTGDLDWLKPSAPTPQGEPVQDVLDLVCEPEMI